MENEIQNTENVTKMIIHKPLTYGKKLYLGEFLAEKFIKIVAFISICSIFAIFYYVFQEATYAFRHKEILTTQQDINKPQMNESESDESLVQESYNPNAEETDNNSLQQEQYTPENNENSLEQETYSINSDTDTNSNKSDSKVSETEMVENSNAETNVDEVESLEDYEEKPVSVKQLLAPNDYIDNKPEYIWQPISTVPKYSFIPLFYGALKVTLIGILIAAPISIFAAIFTVAFSPKWLKEIIKPAIEVLAGFPSVVVGFFCLMTLATVIQELFGVTYRLNSFVGGIGMAIAVIPIVYTVTEDALNAVPRFMTEASLALGASRWQTAWRVLLPSAAPGVFAALILGFGRAFGETMIALMATGNAALVSTNIFESVRTMAATIGSEMAEVEFRGVHYGVLFLIGAVLFLVTFTLNAIAEFYVRKKLMKRIQGL